LGRDSFLIYKRIGDKMDNYLNPKTVPVVVMENEEVVERMGDICNRLLPTIEIPLRNDFALTAIKKMKFDFISFVFV
jgi:2-keto-3-deoxy-6-phosphogluconate aldolase